jgi:hypothetical protein
VLDGQSAMFNILDGDDRRVDIQFTTDPGIVKFCRDAFERAWAMAIPHAEYRV